MPKGLSVDDFIARWRDAGPAERANYQLFLTELCDVINVPHPNPTTTDPARDEYVFERSVPRLSDDGAASTGRIDLYKRGCFVLEAKQGARPLEGDASSSPPLSLFSEHQLAAAKSRTGHGRRGTPGLDQAMKAAYHQARAYIRDLPIEIEKSRPPFLITVDVGHQIRLYSEFTCTGGNYIHFPDTTQYRIGLEDLHLDPVRERLHHIWTDPLALDPAKRSAKVTRAIADRLARLAQSYESQGHDPQIVAEFLMRLIFTMFAEDIGLLGKASFTDLLRSMRGKHAGLPTLLKGLWDDMKRGADFSPALREKVIRFNGGLFDHTTPLTVDADQLQLLIEASEGDWRDVEPAIFGTLLERALDPRERHKLGAHYTPRSYVERLVKPTIIEPLTEEYLDVEAAAALLLDQAQAAEDATPSDTRKADALRAEAIELVRGFHHKLCSTRVLDPACGSGNFLYVTMEHMKRIEGQVFRLLEDIGDPQLNLEMEKFKVRPRQFLGLEINPRAVPIAELVLWIGYLQWQRRNTPPDKPVPVDDPVISKEHSITQQDAVLAYDAKIPLVDADGKFVTIWDGYTTKPHAVTGKEVPDETARKPVFTYTNPRRAEWPQADYIVGNPPFLGNKRMREGLGDGYVEAARTAFKNHNPGPWDFVMFWWHHAAGLLQAERIAGFGLISTNSITQPFNEQCTRVFLSNPRVPLHFAFAIPDHPWVDSVDGAAVRIAMTTCRSGAGAGILGLVIDETDLGDGEHSVTLSRKEGVISSRLTIGVDLSSAVELDASSRIASQGANPLGLGFRLFPDDFPRLGISDPSGTAHLRPYAIGRDLVQRNEVKWVIDFSGLSEDKARRSNPTLFQHILTHVKPERDLNRRQTRREKWWLFGENAPMFRDAVRQLHRYIATCRTAKFRLFTWLSSDTIPDAKIVAIGLFDGFHLGVLSSVVHTAWAEHTGVRMGVGNDLNYNHATCFNTFPFPAFAPDDPLTQKIRDLGERLDAHRKARQAEHPDLTLTGMYNVLEKLRKGQSLTAKDGTIHDHGLVTLLKQIHDDLDAAVLAAYGWQDLRDSASETSAPSAPSAVLPGLPLADRLARGDEALEQALLQRLVDLNHARAEEEKRGLIRWLRPEFQNPGGKTEEQADLKVGRAVPGERSSAKPAKRPWPKSLPAQTAAVRDALVSLPAPATPAAIAKHFTGAPKTRIEEILQTLATLGQATTSEKGSRFAAS